MTSRIPSVLCVVLSVLAQIGIAVEQERRNVLFIAVDDMRTELKCYGADNIHSPNLDRLAASGTLFSRAYCQQAVCNPSRASLLTGLRPERLGIWDLPTHFREKVANVVTLPQLFKNNGYFTRGIGKIFHNWRQDQYQGDAPSWSVPEVMHYNSHGNDQAQVQGTLPVDLSLVPRTEMRDVPDNAYFDGRIADLAVAQLAELKQLKQPFFLAVGFWKPHAQFNAPKQYWDLYDRASILPPSNPHPPANVPPLAMHDSREILRGFKDRPGGVPSEDETLALRHGYYAAISYVDAQIGRVLDELERQELRSNTIVVFWSDHGFHLGEHGLWAKTSNFELDARVPMIITVPGFTAGIRCEAIVELLDIYPTLADLCALNASDALQGTSLRPLLCNEKEFVKKAAFTWHPRPAYPDPGSQPQAMGYSLRTLRYRYTQWRDYLSGSILAEELYDHDNDALEASNVIADESHMPALRELRDVLAQHLLDHGIRTPPDDS
ncbi:MAG: sulfatase [Planctomycetales bacterium]|nr:sulfatase [Planctomycetales bacterium]